MKTSKGRRQHGLAAVLASLKYIKDLLVPLIVLFVSNGFRGGGDGWGSYWRIALGGALVLGAFGWGFLKWWWLRYKVEDGLLKVEEGVLIKKKQSIPLERIQTVDFSEGLLHRLFGLVKVQVQTAGGVKPEAVFAALSRAEADRLDRLLRSGREKGQAAGAAEADAEADADEDMPRHPFMRPEEGQTGSLAGEGRTPAADGGPPEAAWNGEAGGEPVREEAVFKLPAGRLFLAGLTVGNMGVGISLLFAGLSQADDIFPGFQMFRFLADSSGPRALLALCAAALFIAWVLAVASSVIRFWEFTVIKRGDELLLTRGLLERRKVTLPVGRIQAVRITQEIIWRPFGLAAVHVVSAGYGNQQGESNLLFPLMKLKDVEPFLRTLCPECAADPVQAPLQSLSRRAAGGYVLPLPLGLAVCTLLAAWFHSLAWWGLAAAAVTLPLAWGSYQRAAWFRDDRMLLLRSRWLTENLVIVPRRRIQYFTISRNPLQQRSGLASVKVSLAAGLMGAHFSLKGLEAETAVELLVWSRRTKKRREPDRM